MMKEMLSILEENGYKQAERGIVHHKGLLHKAVCVWIMNFKHELIIEVGNLNLH